VYLFVVGNAVGVGAKESFAVWGCDWPGDKKWSCLVRLIGGGGGAVLFLFGRILLVDVLGVHVPRSFFCCTLACNWYRCVMAYLQSAKNLS
jgi:hypothetical protein